MKNIIFYITTIVVVALVTISIKLKVSADFLVGCFTQDTVFPAEKICLSKDGTYTQEHSTESGSWSLITDKGHWSVYQTSDGIGITLVGYIDVYQNHDDLDFFPYKTVFGKVVFIAGPESAERKYLKD